MNIDYEDMRQELGQLSILFREKAAQWCKDGVHERAADLVEMAHCADAMVIAITRLKQLASKCPCCYRIQPIN